MKRRQLVKAAGVAAAGMTVYGGRVFAREAPADGSPVFTLRNPGCGCCPLWAAHMTHNGFVVHLHDSPALADARRRLGIPDDLTSCHTSVVEGYRVEGHVPAELVQRMLDEKPDILGIAVPGMPTGSPGMEGPGAMPYDVIAFSGPGADQRFVFGTATPAPS